MTDPIVTKIRIWHFDHFCNKCK